jgi:hypothetical protein
MRLRERRLVVQSQTVPAFLVNVQIKRHMIFPQRLGEQHRVLHWHDIILKRRPEKTGRRGGRHLQFVGKQLYQFRRRVVAEQIFV